MAFITTDIADCEQELGVAVNKLAISQRDLQLDKQQLVEKERELVTKVAQIRQLSDELTALKAQIRTPQHEKTRKVRAFQKELGRLRSEVELVNVPSKYQDLCKYDPHVEREGTWELYFTQAPKYEPANPAEQQQRYLRSAIHALTDMLRRGQYV